MASVMNIEAVVTNNPHTATIAPPQKRILNVIKESHHHLMKKYFEK
jgi:hypothetical protein